MLGDPIYRRGIASREVQCAGTHWDMMSPIITIPERKLNYSFMFAEALWILRGRSELRDVGSYNGNIQKYSDDGTHLSGAYGPMYVGQQRYIVDVLANDLFTRQAVMTLWRQNPRPSLDIPCTIALQFIIGSKMELQLVVYMRSSDVFLGLPYDVFSFSMMAYHTLLALRQKVTFNITLGNLHLIATSQHVYEKDVKRCEEFIDSVGNRIYKPIYDPNIIHPVALELTLEALRDNTDNLWTV